MATYLILNCMVFGAVLALLWLQRALRINKVIVGVLLVLAVTTMIFDSLLIAIGIYSYNPEKILGIELGLAPIEDFFYALLAGIIVPNVWLRLGKEHRETTKTSI